MKNLYLIFLFMLLSSCANEKKTFWCGDHACINKHERMQTANKFQSRQNS